MQQTKPIYAAPSGGPLNFRDDWQNQINHLLIQEEAHCRELPSDLRDVLVQRSIEAK
jgi:hypothetical protein